MKTDEESFFFFLFGEGKVIIVLSYIIGEGQMIRNNE